MRPASADSQLFLPVLVHYSRLTGVRAGDVVHMFCRPVPACLFKTLYADHLLPQACAGNAHPHVCMYISPCSMCETAWWPTSLIPASHACRLAEADAALWKKKMTQGQLL